MSAPSALLVLLALVAATAAAGVAWRVRTGRVRTARADRVTASEVGAAGLGPRATLVQFSTAFCAQCPSTARVLHGVAGEHDGVTHLDVDLTSRPELARRFGVLQTPTTLLLDSRGTVRGRIAGAARPGEVRSALDRILTE